MDLCYRLEELLAGRANTQTWRAFDVLLARPVIVHLLSDDKPNQAVISAAKKASVAPDFRVLRVLDARIPAPSDRPAGAEFTGGIAEAKFWS